jgi:hypothetical protein
VAFILPLRLPLFPFLFSSSSNLTFLSLPILALCYAPILSLPGWPPLASLSPPAARRQSGEGD